MFKINPCYKHSNRPLRAICSKCKKGLCRECGYNDGDYYYCEDCKTNNCKLGLNQYENNNSSR